VPHDRPGSSDRSWLIRAPRRSAWALLLALLGALLTSSVMAPAHAATPAVTVARVHFDEALRHNIPNLVVHRGDRTHNVPFLDEYLRTGGLTRWGLPISEVLDEEDGTLTQYYQRGVLDWHHSPGTCGIESGYCIERRLAWDYFGGGLGGSTDLGTEPGVLNPHVGVLLGPWGHRVSDRSVEGAETGFRRFYEQHGGAAAFGFPKGDARSDTNAEGTLHIKTATPGFVRQYFQAAVMEWHPGDPEPVKLRLLGDDLRDKIFPDGAWKAFRSFRDAAPLSVGAAVGVEAVVTGPRRVEGRVAGQHITEVCSATSWTPPAQPFCADDALFRQVSAGTDVQTGDVVRTRQNSPTFNAHAIVELSQRGIVRVAAVLRTGTDVVVGSMGRPNSPALMVLSGGAAVIVRPGANVLVETPNTQARQRGTLFLVDVELSGDAATTTTIKVIEGGLSVQAAASDVQTTIVANQESRVESRGESRGDAVGPPVVQQLVGLTGDEVAQAQAAHALAPLVGQTPGPPLTITPVTVTPLPSGVPGTLTPVPSGAPGTLTPVASGTPGSPTVVASGTAATATVATNATAGRTAVATGTVYGLTPVPSATGGTVADGSATAVVGGTPTTEPTAGTPDPGGQGAASTQTAQPPAVSPTGSGHPAGTPVEPAATSVPLRAVTPAPEATAPGPEATTTPGASAAG
jgi:hypothetical protein